ncbi:MAG: translocation/assembly module TamB domain-containing protein [Flavobacteriaceae bacterium]|nr:translocation/assembly module TamB domain-containing protein [Flavobacteriaceae bacterium]
MLAIFLLLIAILIALTFPSVQTYIAKKVTENLNERYDTDINVERLGINRKGEVTLKDVFIADHHKDTLIYAKEVNTTILSFRNLLKTNLNFGDLSLDDAVLNVKTYKGEEMDNLSIFSRKFAPETPLEDPPPFVLEATTLSLNNATITITDENLETPEVVSFKNVHLEADDFQVLDVDVFADIGQMSFVYNDQLVVENLKADFGLTKNKIDLKGLDLKTSESTLTGDVALLFDESGFSDFENAVVFDVDFKKSNIATNELNYFYNEFGADQYIELKGTLKGPLNDFRLSRVELKNQATNITGDFRFENLLKGDDSYVITAENHSIQSNYYDLRRFMPGLLGQVMPKEMESLRDFDLRGSTTLSGTTLETDSSIKSALGNLKTNLRMTSINNLNRATYKGTIDINQFNLGRLLGTKTLGRASAKLRFDGMGFSQENLNTLVSGSISNFTFNDYNYKNVNVSGTLENPIFNGKLTINDPNMELDFEGLIDVSDTENVYDFDAKIKYADLYKTNLFKRDSISIFTGNIGMDMRGTNVDDVVGVVRISESTYQNLIDDYFFDDILVLSTFEDEDRTLQVISPDVINGKLTGRFQIEDIPNLFQNAVASIYANYVPVKTTENQYLNFNFEIFNKIVEVFVPEIRLGENTTIRGTVASDESKFKLNFRSPEITAYGNYIKKIAVQVDNNNPLFNTYIEIDSLDAGFYQFSEMNLINVTLSDTLFVRSEFKGGPSKSDLFNLSMYHTINPNGKSVVGMKRSDILFKENLWFVNEANDTLNKIVFDNNFNDVILDSLVLSHQNELIQMAGKLSDSSYKDVRLYFKDVDIGKITPEIDSLSLSGNVNGNFTFLQREALYYPSSNVTIDNLIINDNEMGNLILDISGNEDLTSYDINTTLTNKDVESITAIGNIQVNEMASTINLDVGLTDFNLSALSPFGGGVIEDIRGFVSGNAKVTGNYKSPDITGRLNLNQTGIKIPELNIDFEFEEETRVLLSKNRFTIPKTEVTDTKHDTKASVNGYFEHSNFSNWAMNLDIETNRFLVLDTEAEEESLYYGTAFITGLASIYGPVDELVIKVDATTAAGTTFKIPISDTESIGDDSFIYFLSPEEKAARISGETLVREELKGLTLEFDLQITRDAEVEVVVDVKNNSTLKGRGEGILFIEINTLGRFNMWGDFLVYNAIYDFRYLGIVQKPFVVERGGNISWNGDPVRANIDIKAIYETTANPSVLLDNPTINRKIPVDVAIELRGELISPEMEYTIDFPTASSIIKSELAYKLDDRQQRELQVLYLISTGSFSSDRFTLEQGTATFVERFSGLVNEIFADEDGKFNVGLNYSPGMRTQDLETSDRLGLTFSSQISERILIDGRVGVPVGGVQDNTVAGDFQIQVLLNEEGNFKWNIFNRETQVQFIGENQGFEQGTGLSYSLEFDSFREFSRRIFRRNAKKEEEMELNSQERTERRMLETLPLDNEIVPEVNEKEE